MIVHDTAPASYGWNVVEPSWTGPQLYMRPDTAPSQTAMNGWVTNAAARGCWPLRAGSRCPDQGGAAARRYRRRSNLRPRAGFDNTSREAMPRNMIGVLPGRTRPNGLPGDEFRALRDSSRAGRIIRP